MSATRRSASAAGTEQVGFLLSEQTGACMLHVCAGTPVLEVMARYDSIIDGLCCLVKRIAREGDGETCAAEMESIGVLMEVAGAMHGACLRSLEKAGGEV